MSGLDSSPTAKSEGTDTNGKNEAAENIKIKTEPAPNGAEVDDDDDVPIISRKKPTNATSTKSKAVLEEDDEENEPEVKTEKSVKTEKTVKAEQPVKKEVKPSTSSGLKRPLETPSSSTSKKGKTAADSNASSQKSTAADRPSTDGKSGTSGKSAPIGNGKSATEKAGSKKPAKHDEEDDDMPLAKRKPVKKPDEDDDDVPIAKRKPVKKPVEDDDDVPIAKRKAVKKPDEDDDDVPIAKRKPVKKPDEDDDDMPIAKRKSVKQTASKPVAKIAKKAKESSDEEAGSESKSEDDDDDHDNLPLAKRKKKEATQKKAGKSSKSKNTPVSRAKPTPKGKKKEESEESEGETSDEPASKKKRTSIKSERSSSKSSSKKKPKDESEEEEEAREKKLTKLQLEEKHIYKWWTPEEQAIIKMKEKKGIKWITLEHNGLLFPPEYEPHGVKMLYNGKPIELTPAAEEIATFYASMLDSDYTKKEKFNKNFMKDWLAVLNKDKKYKKNPHPIEKLELCDFTPIYKYLQEEKEKRKAMSKEEKKKIAEEKSKITEKYMFAKVDGHLEKVGNFRVEPPSLFRGRGDHPKMGKVKTRIYPEDVTINIGEDAPVPPCPIPGHRWGKVVHDNTATWLAHWKDTINGQGKYVFLAASSSFKMMSDFEKYEKARRLKSHVERIREEYTRDLQHANLFERQRATALYLIDRLALRVGNEKDEEQEADTVGCCSLRPEHLEFNDATTEVTFDFLGKDSIRYFNTVKVDQQVFKNMKQFVAKKDPQEDKIFDKLDTPELNKYLKSLMDGLTAKVFRTYNASITLDKLLHQDQKEGRTLNECLLDYNAANREVAILCNHQRAAPKNHEVQVQKIEERIKELEDERSDVKKWMKIAKREGSVTVDEKIKPKKKGDDDASADDDDPKTAKKTYTFEKLENRLKQLNTKIGTISNQLQIKDANKTVALGTSKINYMDPRITVAWCKKYDVPVSKIFNASLQVKFLWALDVDPDWRF